ncbi:MAG: hypothetical protein V1735_06190 [Nanoarchaeota archaeon]
MGGPCLIWIEPQRAEIVAHLGLLERAATTQSEMGCAHAFRTSGARKLITPDLRLIVTELFADEVHDPSPVELLAELRQDPDYDGVPFLVYSMYVHNTAADPKPQPYTMQRDARERIETLAALPNTYFLGRETEADVFVQTVRQLVIGASTGAQPPS